MFKLRMAFADSAGKSSTGNSGKKRIGGNIGKSAPKKKTASAPTTIKPKKRIGGNV
jgi:hypothetical protein